ncbi:MAG: asparagine synthase (glutamine-hydrolyzing) [Desulfosoma sp.]
MCGIGAIFRYKNNGVISDAEQWLAKVNARQRSRGPDGEGVWVSEDRTVGLAHRRLAIIDLSPAGRQPMASEDGQIQITFNGEIYNYKDLRAALEAQGARFRSQSDTEVLIHLYQRYGVSMVEHLRGMYAFALWDGKKGGLLLARDPFGIKPLYYADDAGTLKVASQVKALLAAGVSDTSPEPAGHAGFFLWGWVPEPFTLYRGIRCLPPGSTLWVSRGGPVPEARVHCDVAKEIASRATAEPILDRRKVEEVLGEALEETMRYHMVSDVPVGMFLSAGLDSTSLAALASRRSPIPLRTFTLGFDEFRGRLDDETPFAEMVAQMLGTCHETGWVSKKDLMDNLDHFFDAMDQPTIDGINTYLVSKGAAEKGIKVALSGLGGDELFGGYPSFRHVPLIVKLAKPFGAFGALVRALVEPALGRVVSPKYAGLLEYGGSFGGAYLLRRAVYMPWELSRFMDSDMAREGWQTLQVTVALNRTVEKTQDPFRAVSALEVTQYMRNMLLRDTDWAGMAHSLEIRVPLVDVVFLKTVVGLLRANSWNYKHLLAHCAWNGNPPEALTHRAKTGFSVPISEWLIPNSRTVGSWRRAWLKEVYKTFLAQHSF